VAIVVALAAVVARAQVRADRAKRPQRFEFENAGLEARVFVFAIADPAAWDNRLPVRAACSITGILRLFWSMHFAAHRVTYAFG
jgi:hypothetical protein